MFFWNVLLSSTYNFAILFIYSSPYTTESAITNLLNQLESAEVAWVVRQGQPEHSKSIESYLSIVPVFRLSCTSFSFQKIASREMKKKATTGSCQIPAENLVYSIGNTTHDPVSRQNIGEKIIRLIISQDQQIPQFLNSTPIRTSQLQP
jgi:hypothetical protein